MQLDDYDVTWNTPSADARGSMPLGNGDIALNAWVEADGDLIFYIGKTDAWDDNSRLLKVGRVRVALSPNPFRKGGAFRQALRLRSAEMIVTASAPDAPESPVELRLWVDANRPLVHLAVESGKPVTATISFELWRTQQTTLPAIEVSDIFANHPSPPPTVVEPDTVLKNLPDSIGWYHRNIKSIGPELTMKFQDLAEAPWKDPLLHRTFGALIKGGNGKRIDDQHLESPEGTRHTFSIAVLTQHPATEEQWLASIRTVIKQAEAIAIATRREQHMAWWAAFWDRSYIHIRDTPGALSEANAHVHPPTEPQAVNSAAAGQTAGHDVARGYNLQRFITACAGRGEYPIKFNGSIFTMPWPGKPGDADYRRWGPGYWWQNTRVPYINACAAGDFDQMEPLFRMYCGEVLNVCRYRTRHYFGFEGAYFPECIYSWGAVFTESYGWEQPAAERTDKLQDSRWHKWEWVSGLELAFMLLERYEYSPEPRFLADRVLPTARAVLAFFDNYYKTNSNGKLVMFPSQAAETWWDCTNPMTEVAGLHAVTARILALPADCLPEADRKFVTALQTKLPELPTREDGGKRMLAPAERFAMKKNIENPELYAVYPFRLVSFEKPNVELGIEALQRRTDRGASGWRQDDLFMIYLGLAQEAKATVVSRARQKDPACRFPAFWGPNYDWTPDQDHGGILMKAVQSMLVQSEGQKIFLLPAWPKEWDADFKLHAPANTVISGTVRNGMLTSFTVTPPSRRKDVTILPAQ